MHTGIYIHTYTHTDMHMYVLTFAYVQIHINVLNCTFLYNLASSHTHSRLSYRSIMWCDAKGSKIIHAVLEE